MVNQKTLIIPANKVSLVRDAIIPITPVGSRIRYFMYDYEYYFTIQPSGTPYNDELSKKVTDKLKTILGLRCYIMFWDDVYANRYDCKELAPYRMLIW